ncbi:MAG: hypothetical protein H5T49_04010 [Hadesarchaea archaeon]|nr:hypothetical protein [Candidatus Bipolaricaulota bacterium]MBC7219278.1 hypothetical protein [Hadesarchaea archaeon]
MPEAPDVVELREKLARAAQLLFFRHHMQPGAKAWELRRALGRDYEQILKLLDAELEKLGLTVKRVSEGEEPSESDRYFITLRGHPKLSDARTFGWRVDDMAMLTVALAHILSRGGKAPLKEVERILQEKFPRWRVEATIDRFIRRGYLSEDDQGLLYLGWRAMAEVDQRALLGLLLGKEKAEEAEAEGEEPEKEPDSGTT